MVLTVVAAGVAAVATVGAVALPSWVIVVAGVLYLPLVQAPLYALALAEAPPTMTEGVARYLRLLAVDLLTAVFLAVPALLLSVVGLGVAYGMAYANPGFDASNAATWTASGPVLFGGGTVLGLGTLAMLWLWSRVSLGPAASVADRRVVMLSTWPLTRGLGWRIAVARLVLGGVAVLAVWIVGGSTSARLAPIVCDVLFVTIGLPMEVGVLSDFHARRSPLPAPP